MIAVSHRIIERIFSGAVTRYHLSFFKAFFFSPVFESLRVMYHFVSAVVNYTLMLRDRKVHKECRLSYADFVWFLISEEDKKTETR